MNREDRVRRRVAHTTCPHCGELVGLIYGAFNDTARPNIKTARHKTVPGGPWCPGGQLSIPAAAVVTA